MTLSFPSRRAIESPVNPLAEQATWLSVTRWHPSCGSMGALVSVIVNVPAASKTRTSFACPAPALKTRSGPLPRAVAQTGSPRRVVSAAHSCSRFFTTPLRASVIGVPLLRKADWTSAGVALGRAAPSRAAPPATCGVAIEVPAMISPAAVTHAPGASM